MVRAYPEGTVMGLYEFVLRTFNGVSCGIWRDGFHVLTPFLQPKQPSKNTAHSKLSELPPFGGFASPTTLPGVLPD